MIREKLNSHVKLILDVGVACFRNNYMQTVMNRFEINVQIIFLKGYFPQKSQVQFLKFLQSIAVIINLCQLIMKRFMDRYI